MKIPFHTVHVSFGSYSRGNVPQTTNFFSNAFSAKWHASRDKDKCQTTTYGHELPICKASPDFIPPVENWLPKMYSLKMYLKWRTCTTNDEFHLASWRTPLEDEFRCGWPWVINLHQKAPQISKWSANLLPCIATEEEHAPWDPHPCNHNGVHLYRQFPSNRVVDARSASPSQLAWNNFIANLPLHTFVICGTNDKLQIPITKIPNCMKSKFFSPP